MAVADEMSYQLDSPQVDLNCDRVVFTVSGLGPLSAITSTTAPVGYAVTKTGAGEYTLNVPSNPGPCMVFATSDVDGDDFFDYNYDDEKTGSIVLTSRTGSNPTEATKISCLVFVSRSTVV